LGRVTEDEKILLFQKAWMFVNPSFMEGWGLTTVEANACGTPAIASDVRDLGIQSEALTRDYWFLTEKIKFLRKAYCV